MRGLQSRSNLELDITTAKQLLSEYNSNYYFVFTDYAIGKAFDMPFTLDTFKLRVNLVDKLWNAGLHRRANPDRVAERMFEKSQELIRGSSHVRTINLPNLDLEDSTRRSRLLVALMEMMEPCPCNALSFCSKYLHWAYQDLFVPYDSYVHRSARLLLPHRLSFDVPSSLRSYCHLLSAHQVLWRRFSDDERQKLVQVDFETQPAALRRKLFPLRILDKVLWMAGKPSWR